MLKKNKIIFIGLLCFTLSLITTKNLFPQTTALWCFDEQQGLYPSCVLSDFSDNDYPLVLGQGGQIVEGKYGNALSMLPQSKVDFKDNPEDVKFGLTQLPVPDGRNVPPLSWYNADFAAFMTSGEQHLRNQVGFTNATKTKLNLGNFDWTVEFWYFPENASREGTVFEIGTGPRGENQIITKLVLSPDMKVFTFWNNSDSKSYLINTSLKNGSWQHLVFVYSSETNQLKHFVDGKLVSSLQEVTFKQLPEGDEDYFSLGRNGTWENPLTGIIDEVRFSESEIYTEEFLPPGSFSYITEISGDQSLIKGPELLFDKFESADYPINLGTRKHLFIDDALLEQNNGGKFIVNPPKKAELVIGNIKGTFRKHLNVLEDDEGKIRIYTTVEDDYLAVWISEDGVHFDAPVLPNGKFRNHSNIVLHESVGMGMVFIDPNAPKEQRYKYISDYHRRAVSVFYSEDGLEFKRMKQPVLPFRSGSQANIYYDDQKQIYTAFHRSDFGRTLTGDTQRDFVKTETRNLLKPWPFERLSVDELKERTIGKRVADLIPWYLDNGPLTPGGFSVEYPWIFSPIDTLDPRETDIYVPKVMKYPWAPDTYLAFPILYFHYEDSRPFTREILMDPKRERGSGPLETQVSVSRDGENWKRYPRPAYVGIGEHAGIDVKTAYIAHGMIKREKEIWQYYFGEPHYHSPWVKIPEKRGVFRLVQRLDGFVSLDSPYDREIEIITRPLIFESSSLHLNIDTDAAGYAQVGFLDENDKPLDGFALDDCIYINGDFIDTEVEWMKNRDEISNISSNDEEDNTTLSEKVITSSDLSELSGKKVKMIFRMRGSKLYAMQFKDQ